LEIVNEKQYLHWEILDKYQGNHQICYMVIDSILQNTSGISDKVLALLFKSQSYMDYIL